MFSNISLNLVKQSRCGACELTVTCMSLSLLELDLVLGKSDLKAGKQTNHKVNTRMQQVEHKSINY